MTRVAVELSLALLKSETIQVFTDHFQALFLKCYDEEKVRKALAKARLAEALAAVELFPLTGGDEAQEDYVPGQPQS